MAPVNEGVDIYKNYIMLLLIAVGLFRTPKPRIQ